jgi:hypothetical protein
MGIQSACGCRPLVRKMRDRPRSCHPDQRFQRRTQDRQLTIPISRLSQQIPQRVLYGRQARYADSGCQVGNAGEGDRGDAGCFDLSLNQSYGPATDRSAGDEQDDVHPVLLHVLDHAWHAFTQQYLRLQDVSHIGVVVGC